MKKDVLISIQSTQQVDGDRDEMELTTFGSYYEKNGKYYIVYQESEATGFESDTTTTVKVEGENRVTMIRSGMQRSQLVMERGKRHLCHYGTEYGNIIIGVLTDQIVSSLKENGGRVDFNYTLDIDGALASENTVRINVKECNREHE